MTEEEKEELKHITKRHKFVSQNPLATNIFTTYDAHCLGTVLNLISKLQKELDKKDKVISLMTKAIFYEDNSNSELRKLSTYEIIKEYFYKKAEEENKEEI